MTARQTLLLLPGLLCDARLWVPQRAALGDLAEIVVADLTQQESMRAMAEAALALVPGERQVAVAGLSMGGYVAMEIACTWPERVSRLALLDTRAQPDSPVAAAARRDLLGLARQGRFKGVTRRLLPTLIHPSRLADVALTQLVMAMAEAVGREGFFRQMRAIMARADRRPALAAICCPTLVLCGREDARTPPADSEEIAALIPGAKLALIETCGHLTSLEQPGPVNEALREWLMAPTP
ncbi:MAG: alpha/beta fold hydrolase [Alphaproteobacteria bacterium]|nr:alpha/beta fold hydrolase [Alphaproteobacteria bacterium]